MLALGSYLARVAFTAGLVGEEPGQAHQDIAHIAGLIDDHQHSRSKRQPSRLHIFESKPHIQVLLYCKGACGTSDKYRFKGMLSSHASSQVEEQMLEADAELGLI